MDQLAKRPIAILNLTEELSPELSEYFAKKQILLVDPDLGNMDYEWTHILTRGIDDFTNLRENHKTIERDIRIISLSSVDDLQNFASCNGKLILDEIWLQNPIGGFILDKFLQGYGGIALGDSYPTFKEKGSFNIVNPFNTGEYLDRLVQSAYLEGVSGLSIKTFFDHLVMYLSGLKNKGKIGLPIEVAYGYFNDIFGVQLHFFTKDLTLEDVTASLSGSISKKAEEYLLNVAVQSSDFFDFTLLKEVNKTVVTGLWSKDDRIKVENRGLLFNELTAAATITNYPTEGITSFQMNDSAIEDFSEKIILPTSREEVVSVTTVRGRFDEEAFAQLIKDETKSKKPEVQLIHGSEIEEEIIQIIKGKVEEEEKIFKISGSRAFDVDQFAFKVSAGIEDKIKGSGSLKLKSLKADLPAAIKSSFRDFTKGLNKALDEVTEEDLIVFKEIEVPKLIKISTAKVDSEAEKVLVPGSESGLSVENDYLKNKIRALMTEVKILKNTQPKLSDLGQRTKAVLAATLAKSPHSDSDEAFRELVVEKMQTQKQVSEQDLQKLAKLMERESKLLKEAREHEISFKKLQIDSGHKEIFFRQELEKLTRMVKAKDLIVQKTKEGLAKVIEKKDTELLEITGRLEQTSGALSGAQSSNQVSMIRELERKVQNSEKMIEIYKKQITQRPAQKVEDDGTKEELRKVSMLSNQLKNQLESTKKELVKLQEKTSGDVVLINTLKADKLRLEQILKKSIQEFSKDEASQATQAHEQEKKKLQAQYDLLDNQFRENQSRVKELDMKLQEALRNQKKEVSLDDPLKGKTAHLEGNIRKLTQDLVESKNQVAEMKKETNKLRQEKTALHNQLDKIKKDSDKVKAAVPKKPGTGGKAA